MPGFPRRDQFICIGPALTLEAPSVLKAASHLPMGSIVPGAEILSSRTCSSFSVCVTGLHGNEFGFKYFLFGVNLTESVFFKNHVSPYLLLRNALNYPRSIEEFEASHTGHCLALSPATLTLETAIVCVSGTERENTLTCVGLGVLAQ